MRTQCSEGSIWRKWDLHVHTPASFHWKDGKKLRDMNDLEKKNALNRFISVVNGSECAAFAVMDYWTFDWYIVLKDYIKSEPDLLKKTVLPGMELRIECPVDYRLNIHVLLSDTTTKQQLIDFKSALQIRVNGSNKNLSNDCLIELAKSLGVDKAKIHGFKDPCSLSDDELLQLGSQTAEITKDSLIEAFAKIPDDTGFILLPYDTSDGLLKLDWKKHPQDDNYFMQTAHIFETRDQRNVDLFSGVKTKDNNKFFDNFSKTLGGNPKPCISGSDAHTFAKYGVFPSGKATWIKADPTFEGLKQIIYEPLERVRIQPNDPFSSKAKVYFSYAEIAGSTHYIVPNFSIPLNRELVVLIGGRGSGKSAFLDTFAFLNEEHLKSDRNGKMKIVEYYRTNEPKLVPPPSFTLKTKLIDKDGIESEIEKSIGDTAQFQLPFLYLGQESLSTIATNDYELTKTICDLVGINFNDLSQQGLIARARTILSDIENSQKLIEDVIEKYVKLGYTNDLTFDAWIMNYLSKLIDQQKKLSSKETRKTLEQINKMTEKGIKLKELKLRSDQLIYELRNNEVNSEIDSFNSHLQKLYPEHKEIQKINPIDLVRAISEVKVKSEADMNILRKSIISLKQNLVKQGIKEDVNTLLQASEHLQKQITDIKNDFEENYNKNVTAVASLFTERKKLLLEIERVTSELKQSISDAFKQFQSSREDSTPSEKVLFSKIMKGVDVEGAVDFDAKLFSHHVLQNFVDNRRIGNETDLRRVIMGENEDGSIPTITFAKVCEWIQSDIRNELYFSKVGFKGLTDYVFTEWPSFLRVKAVAKLNNKKTDILSIGQRGTLLLKVYLATATARQVFIIDQPEDNLDNNFIMNELVPLLKKAKQSRQIIMSTHNANLAVNTDAEQIIVAGLDDNQGGYLSGSLENPEIINKVCEILEGGEAAFRKRKERYQII